MTYDKIKKENKFGMIFPYSFDTGLAYRKTIMGGSKKGLECEEIFEYYVLNKEVKVDKNHINITDIKSGDFIIKGGDL